MRAVTVPARRRPAGARRAGLAGGVACAALLAGLAAGPASAAPIGGVAQATGGALPSIAAAGATTTVTLNGQRTLIDWTSFNVAGPPGSPGAETVNFQFGAGHTNWIVLNRIQSGSTSIGGTVNGYVGGTTPGGNVWIVSPNGLVIGDGASMSAGGLLLTTDAFPTSSDAAFIGAGSNSFSFTAPATPSVLQIGAAALNTTGGSLALIAPAVNVAAGARIGGDSLSSVLYGVANAYTITFVDPAAEDSGLSLFSFQVDTPTSVATTPMVLAGQTASGAIYAAGVSQSGVIGDLITVSGDMAASNAAPDGAAIVLYAGGSLVNASGAVTPANPGDGDGIVFSGPVTVSGAGVTVASNLTTYGAATLDAGSGAISVRNIETFGRALTLRAGPAAGDFGFGTIDTQGGALTLEATGAPTFGHAAASTFVDSKVDGLAPDLTLVGDNGLTVVDPSISASSVTLQTRAGDIAFTGAAVFNAGLRLVSAGSASEQGAGALTVTGGALSGSASGSLSLTNGADAIATLGAFSTSTGPLALTTGSNLTVSGAVTTGTGQPLALTAARGNLQVDAALTAGGTMALTAGSAVNVSGAAPAVGGDYRLTGATFDAAALQPSFAAGASGDVFIAASGGFSDTGTPLHAPGTLAIDAGGDVALGAVTADTGDVRVVAQGHAVSIASATAGDDILVYGSAVSLGSATLTNVVQANDAGRDSDTLDPDGVALDHGVQGQRQLRLQATAGAVALGMQASDAFASAASDANTLAELSATGGVTVSLQSSASLASLSAGGAVEVTVAQGPLNLGTAGAGGTASVTLDAGDLTVGALQGQTLSATATSGSVAVGSAASLVDTRGEIMPRSGSIAVAGGTDATLGSASFGVAPFPGAPTAYTASLRVAAGSGTATLGAAPGAPTAGATYTLATPPLGGSDAVVASSSGGVAVDLGASAALTTLQAPHGSVSAAVASGDLSIAAVDTPGAVSLLAPAGDIDVASYARTPASLSVTGFGIEDRTVFAPALSTIPGALYVELKSGALGSGGQTLSAGGPVTAIADDGSIMLGGLSSASGAVVATASAGLALGSVTAAAGDARLTAGGTAGLRVGGALSAAGTATIVSAGAIEVDGGLSAALLTGQAAGTALIAGGGSLQTLGGFSSHGGLTLADAAGLAISGLVEDDAGPVSITSTGGALGLLAGGQVLSGGALALASQGAMTLGGPVTAGGALTLRSGGAVTAGGVLSAPLLTGSSGGPVTLGGTNAVAALGDFSDPSGGFELVDGGPLALVGRLTASSAPLALVTLSSAGALTQAPGAVLAGGSATLASGGALTLAGVVTLDRTSGVLTVASGGLLDESAGAVTVQTLTGSAAGPARLTGTNSIGALGAFTSAGGLTAADTTDLAATGPITDLSGPISITAAGGLTLLGAVTSVGQATLAAGGPLTQSAGVISGQSATLTSGGAMTLDGALALDPATGVATLQSGGVIAGPAAAITAGQLTGRAAGAATLTGANAIGTLGPFSDGAGAFAFAQDAMFAVAGPVVDTAGGVSLASRTGVLTLAGDVDAGSAPLSLGGMGDASHPGVLQAGGILTGVLSATTVGGLSLTDANALGGVGMVVNTGVGDVTILDATGLAGAGAVTNDAGALSITTQTGGLSLGAVSAAGPASDVLLQALDGAPGSARIVVASLAVGRDLVLRGQSMQVGAPDGDLDTVKPTFAPSTGRNLSIQVTSGDFSAGTISPVGGDLRLEALNGDVSVGAATAGDDIFMRADAGALTLGAAALTGTKLDGSPVGAFDAVIATDGLNVSDGLYAVDVGGGLRQLGLTASGAVTLGAAPGALPPVADTFTAAGPVLSQLVSDGGAVTANLAASPAPISLALANGAASVGVATGGLTLGRVQSSGDVTLRSAGDLAVTSVTAGRDATLQSGGDLTLPRLDAGRDASLSAGGTANLGVLLAGVDVAVTSAGDLAVSGRVGAGGSAALASTAGSLAATLVQAGAGSGPAGDAGPLAGLATPDAYAALAAAEPSHDLALTAYGALRAQDAWAGGSVRLASLASDAAVGLGADGRAEGEARAGATLGVAAAGRAWLAAATLTPQGAQTAAVSVSGRDAIVGALPSDVGADRLAAGAAAPADVTPAYHLTLPTGAADGSVQVSASGGLASVRVAQAAGAPGALRLDGVSGGDVFVETVGLDTEVVSATSGDDLYVSAYGGNAILRGGALTRTADAAGDGFDVAVKAVGAGKLALVGADLSLDGSGQPTYAAPAGGGPTYAITGLDPAAPASGADSFDVLSLGGDARANLAGDYRLSALSAAGNAYAAATGALQVWSITAGGDGLAAAQTGGAAVEQATAGGDLTVTAGGVASLRAATLTGAGASLLVSGGGGAALGRQASLAGASDPLSPGVALASPGGVALAARGGDASADVDGALQLTTLAAAGDATAIATGDLAVSGVAVGGNAAFASLGTVQLGAAGVAAGSVGGAAEVRAGDLNVLGAFSAPSLTVEARYGAATLGAVAAAGQALTLGQPDIDNLAGVGGGRMALAIYAGLLPTPLNPGAAFPGEALARGDLSVGQLSLASARLSSLSLYAAPSAKVTATGAVAPADTGAPVALTIGDPADAAWRPGSIEVINDGGAGSSAGALGAVSRPFAFEDLEATNDILFGSSAFIAAVQALPAAQIDLSRNMPLVIPDISGDELAVAGALDLRAQGKVLQQNTSAAQGTSTGILLGGPTVTGPLLTLGTTAGGPTAAPTPQIAELFLSLDADGTTLGSQLAASSDRIRLEVPPSNAYRANGCVIGAAGNCTPLSNFIVELQPDRLTEVDLLRRAEDDALEDPTVAGAANEEIWRKPQ